VSSLREWNTDAELFGLIRNELYSAVVGDICDQLGLRRQFLPPKIRPVFSGAATGRGGDDLVVPVLAGRAMPVLEADVFAEPDPVEPFGKMLDALDDMTTDEVYICAGASPRYALVGELMATAVIARGGAGIVVDGFVRDTEGLLKLAIPTFAHGSYSQDQRGRGIVLDYRVPIEIGGISVRPGDVVVGDIDGVLIVPREHEEDVFVAALQKARTEKTVQAAIAEGMTTREAFRTYGVL